MRLKMVDNRCDESKLEYPECHKCIYDGQKSDVCIDCTAKGCRLSVVKHLPTQYDDEEPLRATDLPEDVEDRFRVALCELFSLKPLELLCLQGIMRQQTLSDIAQLLTSMFEKYKGKEFTRHHMFQLRKSMVQKMPTLKNALLTAGQHKELKA